MPHVKFLPLLCLVLAISTILTTYIISVANGTYKWWLPMISETGNYPPESSIFSWGLTAAAVVSFIMIYIRYLQIKQQLSTRRYQMHQDHRYFVRLNKAQLVFAFLAALGLSLLANFQDANVKPVHVPASLVFFFCAIVHISMMTRLCRFINGKRYFGLHVFRIILPIISTIGLILGITFKVLARNPAYQGRNFDAYSALNEWVCVLTLGFYWLTLYFDLRHIHNFKLLVHTYAFEDDENEGLYVPVVSGSLHYDSSEQNLSPRGSRSPLVTN